MTQGPPAFPVKYFRTSAHLLICQHGNCAARGSTLLYRALWNALERGQLAYHKRGGTIRLTESGCLGACSHGPAMCVYREREDASGRRQLEQGWYAALDLPLAMSVARAAHEGQDLPTDRRYGPDLE